MSPEIQQVMNMIGCYKRLYPKRIYNILNHADSVLEAVRLDEKEAVERDVVKLTQAALDLGVQMDKLEFSISVGL